MENEEDLLIHEESEALVDTALNQFLFGEDIRGWKAPGSDRHKSSKKRKDHDDATAETPRDEFDGYNPDELDWDVPLAHGSRPANRLNAMKKERVDTLYDKSDDVNAPAWFDSGDVDDSPNGVNSNIDLNQRSRMKKLKKTLEETNVSTLEYEKRLREQFMKLQKGTGAWAKLNSSDSNEVLGVNHQADNLASISSLLKTTKRVINKSESLPSGEIDIRRVKNANVEAPSNAVLQSVRFHKSGRLLLTAAFDKRLHLFRIDGETNSRVHSVFFPDMPIHCADFTRPDGSQMVASGKRRFFFEVDVETATSRRIQTLRNRDTRPDGSQMVASGKRRFFFEVDVETAASRRIQTLRNREEKGLQKMYASPDGKMLVFGGDKDGRATLVCSRTKRISGSVKMNAQCMGVAFPGDDGQQILTYGNDANVYLWDVRMQTRCVEKHMDVGGLKNGYVIAASCNLTAPGSSSSHYYYATGQPSGVVNLYSSATPILRGVRQPVRELMNLTTPIDCLQFSPDAQMLLFASRDLKDSLRLFHVSSRTVFSNWPTVKTNLRRVNCAAFSGSS
eukprot:CAMPEP_0184708300 /NCGR_PEP_ID=MMETSP0313-20130426/37705_1 /TAXON_ID=2792 /ORGANISM="Porphyridium aerugineum, Strain SAG 1380-2" /LENGTH=561 /DNA_ID=CAMNT_0027169885 /DNA_START=34 /DNA_END=1715 /DNA_ORIENTATION=-